MTKRLEHKITINSEGYEQIQVIGFSINELSIEHNLGTSDGKHFEQLIGVAEFIDFERLEVVRSDGNQSISKSKLNLNIRKAENGIMNSALANLKDYVGDVESFEEYGLNECVNTGFSHLSCYENMYNVTDKTNFILILADDVYDKLLTQVKSQCISLFMVRICYFNLFSKVKTIANKEAYEFEEADKKIYMIASDNKDELFANTWGYIETFLMYTHRNIIKEDANKLVNENNEIVIHRENVLEHLSMIRNTILLSSISIFILLLFIVF